MKPTNSNDNPWRAVAVVSAVGADLIVCMVAGYLLGSAVTRWTGGGPVWIVLGILLGFVVGVVSVVLLLRRYAGGKNE